MMDTVDLFKTEEVIYKRDFDTKEGKALPDGSYPIETAADLHPAAVLARSGHGDVDAAKALIARRAKELKAPDPLDSERGHMSKAQVGFTVALIKSDVEGNFYGIVAEPDLPDSQGDILSKSEIEQACHQFMLDYALAKAEHSPDVQHSGAPAGADLIENYIAPAGATLAGGPLTEGSWVQAWHVSDPLTKQEIDNGELDGLSLEGSGVRTPVAV